MRDLDVNEINIRPVRSNTYNVPKKLCWFVTLLLAAVFIVLLVLTIYFGVKQKGETGVERSSTTITSVTTVSMPDTSTTTSPLPPVERIPNNFQQLFYQLTITPNLIDLTFTGERMILK